jgi:NADH-quinone oxidoreductase subunit F
MEAGNGKESDLQLLLDICENVEGNTICPLGDALAMPIRSYVQKFEDVFRRHVEQGACDYPKW